MGRDVGAVTFPQNPKMLITIRTESGEHIPETLICLRKVPRKITRLFGIFSPTFLGVSAVVSGEVGISGD